MRPASKISLGKDFVFCLKKNIKKAKGKLGIRLPRLQYLTQKP